MCRASVGAALLPASQWPLLHVGLPIQGEDADTTSFLPLFFRVFLALPFLLLFLAVARLLTYSPTSHGHSQVYNEVIYDLLVRNSGPLELREDPTAGPCVAGLKWFAVKSAAEIMVSGSICLTAYVLRQATWATGPWLRECAGTLAGRKCTTQNRQHTSQRNIEPFTCSAGNPRSTHITSWLQG